MKIRQITIIALASVAMFITSCGNNNSQNEHEGHDHPTETVTKSDSRNENGELVDASGEIITGCPMHKEYIGKKGDKCPKCNYNEMIPITWSMEGIDTVRVTTLSDYNPPQN
ncbi:hypothetical protein [Flavobacterium sp.]|jgi:hypothetical protein|uniref:hypothetical protein n=1 Tax=Flavobacterium sp. TaxID=239 RepID=UPI0035AEFA81